MLVRPEENEYSLYPGQYIDLVPEGDLLGILETSETIVTALLEQLPEPQGDFRYAPGKWSLKEVVGHITDNERIMSYRLLRIARGDQTPLAGYDQDLFMQSAPFDEWSLAQVAEDYKSVRRATYTLLRGLRDADWLRIGQANGSEISARALAYVIAGHEIHHMNVIRERYLP
ncbi:DinB family protein [Paenibacillus xanthanilyticus]|uniref:DinB family protein n=1 Tax=Paenibacillus xanthanilyticus TaxID=1783531 RepID=A0ABV8K4F2_9BACL